LEKWSGAVPDWPWAIGKYAKPLLAHGDQPTFAEMLIVRLFEQSGSNARWTETYGAAGGFCCLCECPPSSKLIRHHVPMPAARTALLREIMRAGATMGCFDVFAWTEQDLVLCEPKRHRRDRISPPQLKFIEGALRCGLSRQSLVIVEWSSLQ
jgi:hypothetical protein